MAAVVATIKRDLVSYRFSLAVRPHRDGLVAMIRRRVGTVFDAEDIVQDALEKAARAVLDPMAEPMKTDYAFQCWLRLLTFNTMKDHFRSLRPANDSAFDPDMHAVAMGTAPSAIDECIEQEKCAAFTASVNRLPPELLHPLIMHEIELMDIREIGEVLGIGRSAAHRRVVQARAIVMQELGE